MADHVTHILLLDKFLEGYLPVTFPCLEGIVESLELRKNPHTSGPGKIP